MTPIIRISCRSHDYCLAVLSNKYIYSVDAIWCVCTCVCVHVCTNTVHVCTCMFSSHTHFLLSLFFPLPFLPSTLSYHLHLHFLLSSLSLTTSYPFTPSLLLFSPSPSLPPPLSLPLSLPPSLSPSLLPSFPPSLLPSFPPSLLPSLPPSLPPSPPPPLPPSHKAANYLDIKGLMDILCKAVADIIRGKDPDQIRTTFNASDPTNPETLPTPHPLPHPTQPHPVTNSESDSPPAGETQARPYKETTV